MRTQKQQTIHHSARYHRQFANFYLPSTETHDRKLHANDHGVRQDLTVYCSFANQSTHFEIMSETAGQQRLDTELSASVDQLKISDDHRATLRRWLGNIFKIVIADGRTIVGCFVCTDRDANVILENSLEYSQNADGKFASSCSPARNSLRSTLPHSHTIVSSTINHAPDDSEPRMLGLALVPGRHIVSVSLMTH